MSAARVAGISVATAALVLAVISSPVSAQVSQSPIGGAEADEHLHQDQIPPPGRHPSEVEIREALEALIDSSIDANGDGSLSSDELRKWLEANHHRILDAALDRQWADYEPAVQEVHSWEGYAPEQKEVLHWEMYQKLTFPDEYMKDDPSNSHFKSMSIMYKRSQNRWKLADANSDTILTKKEFKDFIHPEESAKIKDVLVDEAMDDMDPDKDEQVSLEEYMTHLEEMTDEADKADGWAQTQQTQFTTYLDKNKDGVLNRDELRDWLIPPYDKHEAEAWRLIQLGDADEDRKLTKDEVLKQIEQYYVLLPPDFWTKFMPEESQQAHDEL